MKSLKGTINSLFDQDLPDNCQVVICIYDCSNLENNIQANLIQKYDIPLPKTFPIEYNIEYPYVDNSNKGLYHMSVRIFHNNEILYSNNCKDIIANQQKFRKHLDVFLYYLPFYNQIKEE